MFRLSFSQVMCLCFVAGTNALFVPTSDLPKITQQECETEQNGTVVFDSKGDGVVLLDTFYCEPIDDRPAGERPMAVVVDEVAQSVVGVCCGPPPPDDFVSITALDGQDGANENEEPSDPTLEAPIGDNLDNVPDTQVSREECQAQGGVIVGDIGNGAIFRDDYVCESNGQPPFAVVVPGPGEPIAVEGEVCCGTTLGEDANKTKDDENKESLASAKDDSINNKDNNDNDALETGAIVGIAVGSVAAVAAILGLVMVLGRRRRDGSNSAALAGKDNQSESSGTHGSAHEAEDKV